MLENPRLKSFFEDRQSWLKKSSPTLLRLIVPASEWAIDRGFEVHGGLGLGGSCSAKRGSHVEIWLDFEDIYIVAADCGLSPHAAGAIVLAHELGHIFSRDESVAWNVGARLWQHLPGDRGNAEDYARVARFCMASHSLGRRPQPGEWR